MKPASDTIIAQLAKRNKFIIPVVEIYPRETEDIASNAAPANAIGRFSDVCFDWENEFGTFRYDAKVTDWAEIVTYLTEEVNTAEIKLSNVRRGDGSAARFVLDNKIKGCWMVIRLIFPAEPNESLVIFWGKCQRPGTINSQDATLVATQDIGNYQQDVPFRSYQVNCPLDFARPFGPCLGNESLTEKSIAYQNAVAQFGTGGCNKLYSTCVLLGNTRYFQGQRVVAVSGQFSYVTIEEVVKRVLFWTKRKKVQVVKTDSWSSVNQSESNETIPMAFGRCQLQGHPITWADIGTQVKSLQGFCEGKISAFDFIRSRTEGINIVSSIQHLGDYGGINGQDLDTLFSGTSGYNSGLAYLEIITDGSSPTQVDQAPLVTAVIRGLEIPVPDVYGEYTLKEWTNNPVHVTRFLLTDKRVGRIPFERIDDAEAVSTAAECDTIVEDRTGSESIVLPSNEFNNYGNNFRRYRSAGRYSAYRDRYISGEVPIETAEFPEFEEPEIRWFNPFEPYVLPPQNNILRQKFTFNGAVQEKTSLLEFLNKRVFPTFKGYLDYASNGKIKIKMRKKADNGYLRMDTRVGDDRVPVSNISPWRRDISGYLIIGVSLETAELKEVTGFTYSTACNGLPIAGEANALGPMTVSVSPTMTGGSTLTPALGYVDLGGTVVAGSSVTLTFQSGDDAFSISYIADGTEDVPCFARMLVAFLNANVQFANDLTAYILPDNPERIWIRCESGYLLLDSQLERAHVEAEEVLRVQAVFENCGELSADAAARFDNIKEGSFEWNNEEQDDINAVIAKYISAIDDFHLTEILPRAAWDTIDLEGELNKYELDLTFVDNYWQAAFLAKSEAIERIDGNLYFSFTTNAPAMRLDLGDVVAVKHDSGDGALNYVPVWVNTLSFDLNSFEVEIGAKLYLSAAFDLHVQPIEPLLTTTLGSGTIEPSLPTIGTSGGTSVSTEPVVPRPSNDSYYAQFNIQKYSPNGLDVV